jgi:hypothetical protein
MREDSPIGQFRRLCEPKQKLGETRRFRTFLLQMSSLLLSALCSEPMRLYLEGYLPCRTLLGWRPYHCKRLV